MGAVRSQLVINDGMTSALRRINKAMGLMLNNFEAVQRASGKSVNIANLNAIRQELGKANAQLDEMERNYREINNQQDNLNRGLNTGTKNAGGLLSKIKSVATAYLGMKGVTAAVGLSDTMTSNRARLDLIVGDGGSVAELEQKIYASAQRSRSYYVDTMATVSKLGLVAGKAFSGNDEIIAFQELVNKNFVVGGASATEQASAMYQLTQAMGSGRLQGDEYRSIIENAPLLAKSIEDYMRNVRGATGSMKEWASEGELTADVIKAAVFNSAKEVEERFNNMPKTWSQVWNSIKNEAVMAFDPVLQKINELANNTQVQNTVSGLINGFAVLANVLLGVFNLFSVIYNFVASNWGWIAPIVWGIVAAFAAYNAILLVHNIVQGISTAIKTVSAIAAVAHGTATVAEAAATTGMTAAQVKFNAALYACPLTWILLLIIAIIAIIYIVIGVINKVMGTSISATGVILGRIAAAGAAIWDIALGCLELVLGIINYLINPFIEIANFIGNVFNNPVSSIIYLFQGLADNVLAMLQKIASALDFVFGSNMADTVQGWRDGLKGKADELVAEYAPNENYQDVISNLDLSVDGLGLKRIKLTDAWSAGYNAGEGIEDSIGNMLNFDNLTKGTDIPGADQFTTMGNDVSGISDDTSSLADSSDKSTEELAYLRDIAEKEAINRFTTAEIKVDFSGMTNRIDGDMDVDGVVERLTDGFVEALVTAAEGVHV